MKTCLLGAVCAGIFSAGLVTTADAALIDRGGGLIYDADRDITWYDYSHPIDDWLNQWAWADNLSVTFGGTTYTEWRLPTALNQDGSGPCSGWDVDSSGCAGSEMGHLYYTELVNQAGGPFANTSPFQNLIGERYWSSTWYLPDPLVNAWDFRFLNGKQEVWNKANAGYALAVHSGDVGGASVVPIPGAVWLFGSGLIGLIGIAKRKKA